MNYRDFFKENESVGNKVSNKNVDRKELEMGVKVEMEHTKDKKLSAKIAMDHLSEDPHYYSKLKSAGLADELKENDLMGLTSPLAIFPDKENNQGISEPNTKSVDKQTTPGTVYPVVDIDPTKGPDMVGCMGNTNSGNSGVDVKSDIDSPPKDPTETDHVTGGIGKSPSNPNILSKNQPFTDLGGGSQMMTLAQQALNKPIAKDIEIDIAEGKKILKKMMKETTNSVQELRYQALQDSEGNWKVYEPSFHGTWKPVSQDLPKEVAFKYAEVMNGKGTTKGSATAFSPKEGFVPAAGNPDKDDHFVKGKRWTVDYDKKTPTLENTKSNFPPKK